MSSAPTSQFIDRSSHIQQRNREKMLERHKKKLDEIQSRKVKAHVSSDVEISLRLNENKKQIHGFQQNKKQEMIDKDNQKLLRKLVEIQQGKLVTDPFVANYLQSTLPKSQSSGQLQDHKSKSLHITKRKLELERIERENLKIAQKIYELKPCMQIQELENEFHQHKKYSQNMRRLRRRKLPKHGGKPGQLPPLEEDSGSRKHAVGVSMSQDFTSKKLDDKEETLNKQDELPQQDEQPKAKEENQSVQDTLQTEDEANDDAEKDKKSIKEELKKATPVELSGRLNPVATSQKTSLQEKDAKKKKKTNLNYSRKASNEMVMDKSSPYRRGLSKSKDSLALQKKKKSKPLNDKSATLEVKETTKSREKPQANETQPVQGQSELEEGEKPSEKTEREADKKGAVETGPGIDQQKQANNL